MNMNYVNIDITPDELLGLENATNIANAVRRFDAWLQSEIGKDLDRKPEDYITMEQQYEQVRAVLLDALLEQNAQLYPWS
jgi:hypothetical protein